MKKIFLPIVFVLGVASCVEEPAERRKLIEDCIVNIQTIGNVDDQLAIKYCKCSADTLMKLFSLDDLEDHFELGDKEKYELYLPYTEHCMSKLANPEPIRAK